MTNRLYTFILDYRGGTYIGQTSGDSVTTALSHWVSKLRHKELVEWGITRDELLEISRSDKPVPLKDCINAWCLSGSTRDGLALINVIATDQSLEQDPRK
jgi:hypothetical protein